MGSRRLTALALVFAATTAAGAEIESLADAPKQPRVLPSGAVVYPQGTNPDTLGSPKSGFGTAQHVVNVPFSGFFPSQNGTYSGTCCVGDGERWATGGGNFLVASIEAGLVPNGADLQQVAFYFEDNTNLVDLNFGGYLCRSWVHADGSNPEADCPVFISSLANTGDSVLTADPNLTVLYRGDIDNDGVSDVVSYTLWAEFGINGSTVYNGDVRLRQARLLFQRQVSPAPAVATFNDVPTGHPQFQFIQALVDAGITAGCGSGNYCPDNPLTRGQMAVFLSKALGLNWPAF